MVASNQTVTARLEAALERLAQNIIVHNASTVDVVVTNVTLSDCQNIKNRCEMTRLRVPVKAGQRQKVMTVTVISRDRGHGFRYAWTWEATGGPPPLPIGQQ